MRGKRYALFLFFVTNILYGASQLVEDGFVSTLVPPSPAATNNERLFTVYLPDAYFTNTSETFPVVYYLPGLGGTNESFTESNKEILDDLLAQNLIVPFLVVYVDPSLVNGTSPNGYRTYTGSWYVNSDLNGKFEDYITQELIAYVDANYRTKASGAYRSIMGQSMGGFGSIFLGMRHSNLFNGFGSASGTPFWVFLTDLASPGDPVFTVNSLMLSEIPLTGSDAGKILPTNGELTFSFFSYSGALSPNLTGTTNFLQTYNVDLPFLVDSEGYPIYTTAGGPFEIASPIDGARTTTTHSLILSPTIVSIWQEKDPYYLMDGFIDSLQKQAIYLDGGNSELINAVGARLLSDKFATNQIDHEYILYNGGHTTCLVQEICSRHRTMFQLFSTKFAQAGIYPDDVRIKYVGTGTIEIGEDATMHIAEGTMVGIETVADGVTTTSITINIIDNGQLLIGDADTVGGSLQIGDRYSKARLDGNPALNSHEVRSYIIIEGENATLKVGKQGFLGLAAGVDGKNPDQPDYWGISGLVNVKDVSIDIRQGNFNICQIASGQATDAGLFAIGPSSLYSYNVSFPDGIMRGGVNQIGSDDFWSVHPTIEDESGELLAGGITNNLDTGTSVVDFFYLDQIASTRFYFNTQQRNLLATSLQLDDRVSSSPFSLTTDSFATYYDFLAQNEYPQEASKEGALSVGDGVRIGYVDLDNSIMRFSGSQIPIGTGQQIDFNRIDKVSGTIGIWVEEVDGERQLIRVYDLHTP